MRGGLDHGFSVEYLSPALVGGGTRWLYVGDMVVDNTISTWTGAYLTDTGVWTSVSGAATKEALPTSTGRRWPRSRGCTR